MKQLLKSNKKGIMNVGFGMIFSFVIGFAILFIALPAILGEGAVLNADNQHYLRNGTGELLYDVTDEADQIDTIYDTGLAKTNSILKFVALGAILFIIVASVGYFGFMRN